jgi:hypothetical protein
MKSKIFNFKILLIGFIISLFCNQFAYTQQLVVSGKKIVNSTNSQEVILNAMNFGNWMVMEGYMMNSSSQAPDQHTWKQKLNTLVGTENTKTFFNAWLANHVTQQDVIQVKTWGFNAVRLPLHHEYFFDSTSSDGWNTQGFTLLNNVINWCKSANIYVIIDLHAAPGGQSNNAISDYDSTKPSLWESESNKTKTVDLWKKISEIYKNEPWVAGYDLINEPAWDLPNGTALRDLYNRLTTAIRNNGDNHILFIEGNWYSNDYTGLTPAWDSNMVYVFHKYWSDPSTIDIKWITDFRNIQNRPIWCGEHGENSNDHFTEIVETFTENGIGMSWWPMKKFESINCFSNAKFPTGYTNLLNYFGGSNPGLNPTTAFNTLMLLAESVKLANCTSNNEVLRAVFTQPGNRNTQPFSTTIVNIGNTSPTRLYTPNYDQGMNGFAYFDQEWEDFRLTTGFYTSWNNGWVYRNGGVDIEKITDAFSNGYTVGWFNKTEWMKYTIQVNATGIYNVEFRIANGNSFSGEVQIQNADGTRILGTVSVPPTGGWSSWQTVSAQVVLSNSGTQTIRVVNTLGEFNVSSLNFIYNNPFIPSLNPVVKTNNIIYLKGNNSSYVTYSSTNYLLSSTSTTLGAKENFTLIDAGNGYSALKGANGKYVSLNLTDRKLYCIAENIGSNEKFILKNLSGAYSLKGSNSLYVTSDNGSINGLVCNKTVPAGWEFFKWGITGTEALDLESLENQEKRFVFFPNPANDNIFIKSPSENLYSATVFDLRGRFVIDVSVSNENNSIDISHIPEGVYLLRITDSNFSETFKFIKSNK